MHHLVSVLGEKFTFTKRSVLTRLLPASVLAVGLTGAFQLATVLGAQSVSVSVYDYSQCSNDDGDGYASGDTGCRWINGNLQANNSTYHEGDATVQRVLLEDVTNGSHTITFQYDTTKNGKHAYDFLTDDNFSELAPNSLTNADMCDGASSSKLPSCASLTPSLSPLIPTDSNAGGFDAAQANRHFKIRNGTITTVSTPAIASGSYAGDSDTAITVTFSVDTASCAGGYNAGTNQNPVPACAVLISFGAHISSQADWGPGTSAVSISGSPYHVALANIDGTSIGQRDNQMQASAIIVTPTVTTELHKADHSVVAVGASVPLGTTMHDMVTVTGSLPTGSVVLNFYNNGTCTGTPLATSGSLSLTNGSVDATGFAQGPLAAGTYGFLAHYNGDRHNTPADATCEYFTVSQSQLTVNTKVHDANHNDVTNSSISLGSVVHDTSKTSGGVAGFTVPATTFTFYANGTCSGDGTAVTNTGADEGDAASVRSAASNALLAGSYSYKASVAGDANYLGDNSDCEPFTVNKANTSVATAIHLGSDHATDVQGTTIALNSSIHDKATLGGQVGSIAPTGSLDYKFYLNGTCDGTPYNTDSALALGSESSTYSSLAAGHYSFLASYSGDTNYNSSTGTCESVEVVKSNTTTTTQVHDASHNDVTNTSVALGSQVHDSASVATQVGSFTITGTVTYTLYNNGTCNGSVLSTQQVAVGTESSVTAALASGNYSYKAVYSGDTNYNGSTGDCEPFSVSKSDLTVDTELHTADESVVAVTSAVALGTTMHDKATVGGIASGFAPANNVTFTFYTNGTCDGSGTAAGSVALAGNVAHPSSSEGPLTPGDYSFSASIAGDANYNGGTSSCEPFSVSKAGTTTVTEIHKDPGHVATTSINLGDSVHDKAIVSSTNSSFTMTGTVTYTFFTSGDCTTGGTAGAPVAVGSESGSTGALGAGAYSYHAVYGGDTNYNGSTGDCEPLTVNKAAPTVVTELHNSDETVIATEAKTATVHDKATVTGGVNGFAPSGNVEFTFFSNGTCSPTGAAAGTVALGGGGPGTAHPSTSEGPLSAGSYSFRAHYVGDANYADAYSECEPFTVTTLTINKLANGGNDTFGFTVSGPTNASPSILTTGTPGTGTVTLVVFAGQYTVGETNLPAGWQLVGLSCAGSPTELGPTSSQFTITAGTNAVCNFENTKNNKTRTQGFWSTHTLFANQVWNNLVPPSEKNMSQWGAGCSGTITATTGAGTNGLMGGFWANIANKTTKDKRTSIDKTRMQLLQQLLAAILNKYGLGANDGGLIDQAEAAYCGSNQNLIQQYIGLLGNFNSSGDSVPLSFTVPNATPAISREEADLAFWNNPTTHI